jgi:hypothetical protein
VIDFARVRNVSLPWLKRLKHDKSSVKFAG